MSSQTTCRLPWPSDVIVIVAARAGREIREQMEGVVDATCRHCGGDLRADTRTLRRASELPERRGRPIEFFCIDCAVQHQRSEIDLLVDQRNGQDIEFRRIK